jgi:hypothetical protein
MISIEPVNIHFSIPASDPLGRQAVLGKLRFMPELVTLSWRLKGNVFRGGKSEMITIDLPYGEIEHVALVKKWFRVRQIVLRIATPELVQDIPGVDMGKMTLDIDDRSREEAKKLIGLIDFKRSIFILDDHEKRLKTMRSK